MINRSMQPRQMYGLGSLVKKAVKGVKSVIKSPIGKAAILGAVGFGIPGTSFGGVFGKGALSGLIGKAGMTMPGQQFGGGSGLLGLFSKAKNTFSGLSTAGKLFAGGTGFSAIMSMFPQNEGEDDDTYADRIRKLEPLFNRYYKNVNPNASASEIKKFIQDNTQEYMAKGGRVGYRFGGDTMEKEGIKSLEAGAPDVKYSGDMRLASETGPEEFEMDIMSELMQAFDEAKRSGFQGDFKSFLDMYMGSQARAPEGIMQEAPIQMAANGGRIGFGEGTPKDTDEYITIMTDDGPIRVKKSDYESMPGMFMDTTTSAYGDAGRGRPVPEFANGRRIRFGEGMDEGRQLLLNKKYLELLKEYSEAGISDADSRALKEANEFVRKIKLAKGGMPMEEDEEDSYRAGVMSAMMGRKKVMGGGMMEMPTGIMRMNQGGIMERDYRDEGGFVPVGIKEKADDVPAMLSKNEFVMTADAVRGAGNGSIEKGAQKMYDTMKSLEKKVG